MNKSKPFIVNLVIAGIFIALGLLMPGSTMTNSNELTANIAGIATGFGIAWIIKAFADNKPPKSEGA